MAVEKINGTMKFIFGIAKGFNKAERRVKTNQTFTDEFVSDGDEDFEGDSQVKRYSQFTVPVNRIVTFDDNENNHKALSYLMQVNNESYGQVLPFLKPLDQATIKNMASYFKANDVKINANAVIWKDADMAKAFGVNLSSLSENEEKDESNNEVLVDPDHIAKLKVALEKNGDKPVEEWHMGTVSSVASALGISTDASKEEKVLAVENAIAKMDGK